MKLAFLLLIAAALPLRAQTAPVWTMQDSGSHASLRGIHSVDGKIAWASGSGGTVLRTMDGGEHWTQCATPDAATDGAKLDFRGVQAWDANTAIVMSSGPGELSRLYKTTDGCKTWALLFKNPDENGFWDAFKVRTNYDPTIGSKLIVFGDPVDGDFVIYISDNMGQSWKHDSFPKSLNKEGAFAASNSSFQVDSDDGITWFGTGGPQGARVFTYCEPCTEKIYDKGWYSIIVPSFGKGSTKGIFSLSHHISHAGEVLIAVGGDYTKPNESSGTAAWSSDGGEHWTAAAKPPHGYRSTVEWSEALKIWITAGTNGSDFSADDGKSWQPLDDGNWNALSLPFITGPDGRIARLDEAALKEKLIHSTVKN